MKHRRSGRKYENMLSRRVATIFGSWSFNVPDVEFRAVDKKFLPGQLPFAIHSLKIFLLHVDFAAHFKIEQPGACWMGYEEEWSGWS